MTSISTRASLGQPGGLNRRARRGRRAEVAARRPRSSPRSRSCPRGRPWRGRRGRASCRRLRGCLPDCGRRGASAPRCPRRPSSRSPGRAGSVPTRRRASRRAPPVNRGRSRPGPPMSKPPPASRSGGFDDLARAQAARADAQALDPAVDQRPDALEIRFEAARRDVVRVADVAADDRPFPAEFAAFCHDRLSSEEPAFARGAGRGQGRRGLHEADPPGAAGDGLHKRQIIP